MVAQDAAPTRRVIVGENLAEPELCDLAGGRAALFSTRSPDKDSANEDAAGVFGVGVSRALLVVADGMGGAAAGGRASAEALACVARAKLQSFGPPTYDSHPTRRLLF